MKRIFFAVAVLLINSAFGQSKVDSNKTAIPKDSTIQITMSLNDFRAVLMQIDKNIDSKAVTAQLLQFLQQSARLIEPDKPKQPGKPNKEQPK